MNDSSASLAPYIFIADEEIQYEYITLFNLIHTTVYFYHLMCYRHPHREKILAKSEIQVVGYRKTLKF